MRGWARMRVRIVFVALAMTCGFVFAAAAREPTEPVELTVWRRSFVGTLGDKNVEIAALERIGDRLRGHYCYGRCDAERPSIALHGRWTSNAIELEESIPNAAGDRTLTGRWRLKAQGDRWQGEWRSPDAKRRRPVALTNTRPAAFADELRVLAEHPPGDEDDTCESQSPAVTAIRIYRDGRLRQTLPTDSMGTCGMFLPELTDMNFDGKPDVTIALTLPAGPNIPHQSWLYDTKRGRFVDAPASLQDITSPMFDHARKLVYNDWRGSCCSHGVDIYRWKDGELVRIDGAESHFMPVVRGGKLGYVYSVPSYEDGRIVFAPRIERDPRGRLRPSATLRDAEIDFETAPPWSDALKVDVYASDGKDGARLVSSHAMRWRKLDSGGKTRWCPDAAYFDLDRGRIDRRLIDDAEACTDSDPNPAPAASASP